VLNGACERLQVDGVKALLAAGAPVGKGDKGVPALYYAVYAKCPKERIGDKIAVINLLFDAGARVVCDMETRENILHVPPYKDTGMDFLDMTFAVPPEISDVYSVFPTLLERELGLAHYRDLSGATPLMLVVQKRKKHVGMVRALLDAGADPLMRDNDNRSALWYLLTVSSFGAGAEEIRNMCEIMRMLLAAGADPTVCSASGETLLMQVSSIEGSIAAMLDDCFDNKQRMMFGYILDAIASRPAAME
jgi:hypothetical protein